MNDSTSTTSPAWPTRWSADSFAPRATALFGVAALVAFSVILIAGVVWLRISGFALSGTNIVLPALIIQLLAEAAVVALIVLYLPRLSGFSLRALGFRALNTTDITWALGGAVVMTVVTNGGAALLEALTHTKHDQQVVQLFESMHDPHIIAFFAFFAIVLGPIAEEMIFRVFCFNLALRYVGLWPGVAISALLFGLAHGDPFALIPLAMGGAVLAYVYYRTNNAYASMISHGLFNSLTVFALLYAPQLAK